MVIHLGNSPDSAAARNGDAGNDDAAIPPLSPLICVMDGASSSSSTSKLPVIATDKNGDAGGVADMCCMGMCVSCGWLLDGPSSTISTLPLGGHGDASNVEHTGSSPSPSTSSNTPPSAMRENGLGGSVADALDATVGGGRSWVDVTSDAASLGAVEASAPGCVPGGCTRGCTSPDAVALEDRVHMSSASDVVADTSERGRLLLLRRGGGGLPTEEGALVLPLGVLSWRGAVRGPVHAALFILAARAMFRIFLGNWRSA